MTIGISRMTAAIAARSRSEFFHAIRDSYGSFIGQSLADAGEGYLRRWGIDPANLREISKRGNNAHVFSLDDTVAIKVNCELETHQKTPLGANPLVLDPFKQATIGFDQGQVPITVSVFPYLDTKKVESRHVKALCHELYTKYGLLFRDNKPENVGLTKDGLPYVIDAGSLMPVDALPPTEPAFLYPQWSGYQGRERPWDDEASRHGFVWPLSQLEVPEISAAAVKLVRESIQARVINR